MAKSNKKAPIVLYVGMMLLCVLFISTYHVGGLYARFSTNASGLSDTRVAKFSVSAVMGEQPSSQTIDLSYADDLVSVSWSFTVTSESEVIAVDTVTVTLPSECPVGLSLEMTVNGNEVELTTTDNKIYTCSADIGFSETHTWVLTFVGDPDTAAEATLENIKINVKVEQID